MARVGFRTCDLAGGFGGSGQHLDYLLEGGGVGLDEGGRVRVGGVGSGHGFRGLGRRGRWWSVESIAVGAACAAVGGVAVWGGKRVWVRLSSRRGFH